MSTEKISMGVGESRTVALQSRGTTGLQLLYRTDDDKIVQVNKVRAEAASQKPEMLGAAMPVSFELHAIAKGTAQVTFYETRPWDKSFKEIIQKELSVEVH